MNDDQNPQEQPQKPQITDEDIARYTIPGTNVFNLTRWVRENTEYPPPKFKVGDVVVFTVITEITGVGKDCDGSILYSAEMIGHGWGEENFREATEEESKNY